MNRTFQRLIQLLTVGFIGMIVLIIWSANTQQKLAIIKWGTAFPYADKLGHLILIGGATLLLNLSLSNRQISLSRFSMLLGSAIIGVLITLEEVSQQFIRDRTFDWLDLTANYVGIFVAGWIASFFSFETKPLSDRNYH